MRVSCLAGLEPRIHGHLRWPYLVSLSGKTEKAEKESNRVEPLEEAKGKGYLTSEGGREDQKNESYFSIDCLVLNLVHWEVLL